MFVRFLFVFDMVGIAGKNCLLALYCILDVLDAVFLSRLASKVGCGIRLYRHLIIAFSSVNNLIVFMFISFPAG